MISYLVKFSYLEAMNMGFRHLASLQIILICRLCLLGYFGHRVWKVGFSPQGGSPGESSTPGDVFPHPKV